MIGWERRVLLRHYLEQGMTKTELAERFGISRQTIYRWIRSGELDRDLSAAGVHYSARAPVATKLDRYRDILVSRLGEYPDLTAVRLFEEIKAAGYAGGYTQVKEYVPLSANVRETRSTQRIRVGRRQRKRTCWDCEREWKRMVMPLEPGRPSEARQLLRTRRW